MALTCWGSRIVTTPSAVPAQRDRNGTAVTLRGEEPGGGSHTAADITPANREISGALRRAKQKLGWKKRRRGPIPGGTVKKVNLIRREKGGERGRARKAWEAINTNG